MKILRNVLLILTIIYAIPVSIIGEFSDGELIIMSMIYLVYLDFDKPWEEK